MENYVLSIKLNKVYVQRILCAENDNTILKYSCSSISVLSKCERNDTYALISAKRFASDTEFYWDKANTVRSFKFYKIITVHVTLLPDLNMFV